MPHCRQCGAALEHAEIDGRRRERCPACATIAFRNPLPVGLALIDHGGQLVLVRRSIAPLAGYWAPPGGYVEIGESVPEAVIREAREETGLGIAIDGLIGVWSQADVNVLIVGYHASSIAGEPQAGDDAAAIECFPRGKLPAQERPATGAPIDFWFYDVIREITASWR